MLRFHGISRRDGDEHDGIHLLWSPPYPTGYCLEGFTIQRRRSEDQEQFRCFDIHPSNFQRARTEGFTDIFEARIWASPTDQTAPASAPWSYRIELREIRHELRMNSPYAICAFAARADGTVIDGQLFAGTACRLTGGGIAVVWIVANTPKSALRICGDSEAEGKWEEGDILIKDLQVPFARVNPDTPDLVAERQLATERAQPDTLQGDFGEVSRYGNAAYARAFDIPAWRVTTHDPETERDQWDTTPLGFVLAASALDPAWRRALGFGFLDNKGLTDGARYDYRISGLVPRADRDERRLDFHTVPRGQTLPRAFRLADLTVICDRVPVVTVEEAGGDAPTALWKGIECDRIWLRLPHPTTRIALAGRSDGPLDIVGIAGFLPVATLSATLHARTVLDFGVPVTEVLLEGPMFITAFMPEPLAAGLDPDEPVEVSEVLRGIAYVPTLPPDPPTDVTAENLGSAARAARRGQRDDTIGFEVTWMPPLRLDPATLPWWPPDARTAPPTDVAAYRLERSLDGRPFKTPKNTEGAFVASRNSDPRTEAIAPGADLLAVYPPANESGLAKTERVRAIDTFEGDGPKFGTDVTYGISCIDAIGRASTRALSPPVPLEKRIRPPAPIGPPKSETPSEGDALVVPSGVGARLLQATDPDLTTTERALVDSQGDVVVLKWGWGPVQRKLDPLVKEFRIYETDGKLAEITATITAPPVALSSGGWRLSCSFSRPVTPNEFAGTKVVLGLAYEIATHATGSVDLHPAVVDSSRSPVGSVMTFIRTDGSEEDPESWDSRVQVAPRGSTPTDPKEVESYELVLPASWISVSPSSPRQIRSFGVSAADGESYVDDRRLALEPSPRSGNESPVSPATVIARYRGRPSLSIADLGPVSAITLDRAAANGVPLDFVPASYLPSGASPLTRMRVERAPASAVLPRIVIGSGGISLADRAGVQTPWVLSPADETQLRSEAADRAISERFLAHAVARLADLDGDFDRVADADPTRSLRDTLPNSPARWVYRLRALDAGGRASAEGQVLELVVRVPRLARAVLPQLTDLDIAGGTATVNVKAGPTAGAVFLAHSNDTRVSVSRAELSSIRNRPDLPATDRFIVRDDRGTVLDLTQVTPASDGTASASFTVPDGRHFHVWAFAVSEDDVPSRLVGPLHAFRGFPMENA